MYSSESSAANTSVQNNLPNPESANAGETGTQESRQEETTNYEISRSVRSIHTATENLQRAALAIA